MWQEIGIVLILIIMRAVMVFESVPKYFNPNPALVEDQSKQCILVGEEAFSGAEDIVHFRAGLFLVSSGDVIDVILKSSKSIPAGGIFVIDLEHGDINLKNPKAHGFAYSKLRVSGYPYPEASFHPHGIGYSNATGTLYVVNHPGTEERVEIFQVKGTTMKDLELVFKRVVLSPLFLHGALNDVTEGGVKGEFYVTQWLAYPLPENGLDHPASLTEVLNVVKGFLSQFFFKLTGFYNIGWSYVFRCTFDWDDDTKPGECKIAADNFVSANGISLDTKTKARLFVIDCWTQSLRIYDRGLKTGTLRLITAIKMPVSGDNIQYDSSTNEVLIGTINNFDKMLALILAPSFGKYLHVEGGLTVGKLLPGPPFIEFENVLHQEGTMMSSVSSAGRYRDWVILGSAAGRGVLICKKNDEI